MKPQAGPHSELTAEIQCNMAAPSQVASLLMYMLKLIIIERMYFLLNVSRAPQMSLIGLLRQQIIVLWPLFFQLI